jgi:hypothetical protein
MEKEKEYQEQLDKVPELLSQSYLEGRIRGEKDAKKEFAGTFAPETVEITIRVRGKEEEVETVRRVVSFETIRQSRGKVLRLETEETLAKIATQGILQKLILED